MNTQIQEFFKTVRHDETLQAKLAGCGNAGEAGAMKTLVQVAAGAGYSFSEADLGSAVEAVTAELTPEQLDQVAGGSGDPVPTEEVTFSFTGDRRLDLLIRKFTASDFERT